MFSRGETREFRISQEHIDQRRSILKGTSIFSGMVALGSVGVLTFFNVEMLRLSFKYNQGIGWLDFLLFAAPIFVITAAVFFLHKASQKTLRKLTAQHVTLTERGVERDNGEQLEVVRFEDIEEIRVHRDRADKLIHLSLITDTKEHVLAGLDGMEDLLSMLEQRLFKVAVSEERIKLEMNRKNFVLLFSVMMVVTAVMVTVAFLAPVTPLNTLLNHALGAGAAIVGAIAILARRPVSDGVTNTKAQRWHSIFSLLYGTAILTWLFFF